MENNRRNIVYVNPNFSYKQSSSVPTGGMYVNPNFKGNHDSTYSNAMQMSTAHKIHINPKLIKVSKVLPENMHPIIPNILPSDGNLTENRSRYIVNNKNKFVKVPIFKGNSVSVTSVHEPKPIIPVSQVTKKPSYSFVRKDTTAMCDKTLRSPCMSNVWKKKLDSRITYSLYSIRKRKSLSDSLSKHKQKKVSCLKHKVNNEAHTATTQISCVSHNKQTPSNRNVPSLLRNISQSVWIGGEKYFINNNILHRAVKSPATPKLRQVKKVNLCGITYVRKSDNVFVMDNRMKNSMQKRKKINITCPVFRRMGICKKHNQKKCPLVHDPKNISICQKFLKGICGVEGCHLSHQVILEKMPTCKFFLEGCCLRENCPYLHVKVNESASICLQFLNGYCEAGINCNSKHINICPNFYKYSKCDRVKCTYPHKILPKTREPELLDNCPHNSLYSKVENKTNDINNTSNDNNQPKTTRYFEDNDKYQLNNSQDNVSYKGRSKLGDLPSYISL